MDSTSTYHIGTSGQPWGSFEKKAWFKEQKNKRSYAEQVLSKVNELAKKFDVVQYGLLPYESNRYPLYAIKSNHWSEDKPNILITGGVHGYETSGVHGALSFMQNNAEAFEDSFNIVLIPCVSPWGYETINRWNPAALDPNRSFYDNSPAPESAALMAFVKELACEFIAHIDLHETTDTDNSEFRPALAARDAIEQKNWNIPDGFYLVGDSTKPQAAFQQAIIQNVEAITHIAPADENNKLIGVELEQKGVINYAARALGLCMGLTEAPFVTTTEVYPDSPLVDDENCVQAQVAVITGALAYLQNIQK